MNKASRLIKRRLALILVLLFSIESFAAVVGDNDGAAFITKAEFDSMKNDFQEQLDRYNSSLDNKIDGAIASYLSGIKMPKQQILDILTKEWETVTMTSYFPNNAYQFPNLSLYYSMMTQGDTYFFGRTTTGGNWWKQTAWWWANVLYNRTSGYCQRLLCDAGAECATVDEPEYIVWLGRSTNMYETITASKIQSIPYTTDGVTDPSAATTIPKGYMPDTNNNGSRLDLLNILDFHVGYWPNASSNADQFWNIGSTWYASYWHDVSSGYGEWKSVRPTTSGWPWPYIQVDCPYSSYVAEIKLNELDGKSIIDKHLLTYDNLQFDNFTDVDWLHTLNIGASTTPIANDWINVASKTGDMHITEDCYNNDTKLPKGDNQNYGRVLTKTIDNYYAGDTSNTSKIRSIGMLNKIYKADKILQISEPINITIGTNDYKTPEHLNLMNGLPVLYGEVNKYHKIKWKPVFKTYNNDIEVDYDVNVALIQGDVWKSGQTKGTSAVICKNDGQTNDYLTTSDGTCTFDFTVPGTGIIYAKWWPADDAILNANNWMIEIDLTNCGTFELLSE